ncbi:ATP-binding cassette domain-containing protein [Streptomyces tricolor]|nr:ATP-binding cassette domain-containing protein [Streptomyces tricolor]
MTGLELRELRKTYRSRGRPAVEAVRGLDLALDSGELLGLLGPSGCGKSTTLRMIAGLEAVTGGDILIGGASVTGRPARRRNIRVAFENYALYPPLTVAENLAFGLKARGRKRPRRGAAQGRRDRRAGRAHRRPRRPPGRPVQRAEAAGQPGPRADPRTGRAAAGRAAVPPGRGPARHHPPRTQADPAGDGAHHHPRHARPGGGPVAGRPDRRHAGRRDRAARHPVRDLRPSGDRLRGRLRRRTRDQPAARRRRCRRPRPRLSAGVRIPLPVPVPAGRPVLVGIRPEDLALPAPTASPPGWSPTNPCWSPASPPSPWTGWSGTWWSSPGPRCGSPTTSGSGWRPGSPMSSTPRRGDSLR